MTKSKQASDASQQAPGVEESAFSFPMPFPGPFPGPFPFQPRASGTYETRSFLYPRPVPIPEPLPDPFPPDDGPLPGPLPGPGPDPSPMSLEPTETGAWNPQPLPWWRRREELRLDVDGHFPQMTASGTARPSLFHRVEWIANLTATGPDTYGGTIWFKDGDTAALPYTTVSIQVVRSWLPIYRRLVVRFSGPGLLPLTRYFGWDSAYFSPVELEFDTVEGTSAVRSVETCAHPNRPSGLTCETLSVETVFRRAGFDVTSSGGDGTIPLADAGSNGTWSDMEMHDAMQAHWSRFADKAQWSMWVLNAALSDSGSSLGGIMFDDIGPNHRQGTAIFNDSFIKDAPSGDADPAAWAERMKFWTTVHEMGHGFNLAHSWQKSLGSPWIPLADESEARSFMNYPYFVAGGQTAFFSDFEYRFSDDELLFLRHAPRRFVQMGNADWFDDHGFENALVSPEPTLRLEVRAHRRERSAFEFLEPVLLELKLQNVSAEPQIVDESVLTPGAGLTLVIKKRGAPARRWMPFTDRLERPARVVLQPGEAVYRSLPVSAGLNGWDLSDPGQYAVQAALHLGAEDLVSAPFRIQVLPPARHEEEVLAQDYFSDEVGRVLAFGGSMFLASANKALRNVAEELGGSRAALHARYALANPSTRNYKRLAGDEEQVWIDVAKRDESAMSDVRRVLEDAPVEAVETFGHIGYHERVDQLCDALDDEGQESAAAECQRHLHKTLSARQVLPRVLAAIEKEGRASSKSKRKPRRRSVKS